MESNPLSSLTKALCIFFYIYIPSLYTCILPFTFTTDFVGLPDNSNGKVCRNVGEPGLIPGSGRCPVKRNGNPLQYSCLENPMDGGAWQATIHGVTKSGTLLTSLSLFHFTLLPDPLPQHTSYPIDRVPEELWTELHDIVQEAAIITIPKGRNAERKNGCLRRSYK